MVVQILHCNRELGHPALPSTSSSSLKDKVGGQSWDFVTSLQRHHAIVGDGDKIEHIVLTGEQNSMSYHW